MYRPCPKLNCPVFLVNTHSVFYQGKQSYYYISALKCKQLYLFEFSVKPALKTSLRTDFCFIQGFLFQPRDECLQIDFAFQYAGFFGQ